MNCKVVLARAARMWFAAIPAALCLLLAFARADLDAGSTGETDNDLVLGTSVEPLRIERASVSHTARLAAATGCFRQASFDDRIEDTRSIAWKDYDGDGDLDLVVGNYGQANRLYRNEGSGVLTDVPTVALYLPLFVVPPDRAPDLIVASLTVTHTGVQLVIVNRGEYTVAASFWVDAYVDPYTVPTTVNQTWNMLAEQGMVWGVERDLGPKKAMTLTLGDLSYWGSESRVSWPLPEGTQLYAQVDSYGPNVTYGAVLETHEIARAKYNNILGPAVVPVVPAK